MIKSTCPKCSASLQSPDSLAGKKETCPECGEEMAIPKQEFPDMAAIEAHYVKKAKKAAKTKRMVWLVFGWLLIGVPVFCFLAIRLASNTNSKSRTVAAYIYSGNATPPTSYTLGSEKPIAKIYGRDIARNMDSYFEGFLMLASIITGITILHRESLLARQIEGIKI
jgi:hypothetical protein